MRRSKLDTIASDPAVRSCRPGPTAWVAHPAPAIKTRPDRPRTTFHLDASVEKSLSEMATLYDISVPDLLSQGVRMVIAHYGGRVHEGDALVWATDPKGPGLIAAGPHRPVSARESSEASHPLDTP